MSNNTRMPVKPGQDDNLAEEILKGAGKSAEEVKKTGQLDRGDDLVELTYEPKFRTVNSPVHRALWSGKTPVNLFRRQGKPQGRPAYLDVFDRCIAVGKKHLKDGTLFGPDNKVTDQVVNDLAKAGYWGLLVDTKYGGSGAKLVDFMPFITRFAAEVDPTIAGMNSIHECIGAVDPLEGFATEELKAEVLPKLASGERLSAFALTEPGAGSDLTALKTTAHRDGDHYVVNGRKLFISNVQPGRTVGLVVMVKGKDLPPEATLYELPKGKKGEYKKVLEEAIERIKGKDLPTVETLTAFAKDNPVFIELIIEDMERARPTVLIVDLPDAEGEDFQLDRYGIHAVKHIHNCGMIFNNFKVPVSRLLIPTVGDGLTVAYHGLNRGRVALCANAAGTMRILLKSIMPWADFRETYGEAIGTRELVQKRIGKIASMIVGADALVLWGSSLLDEGYRGELECIVAKIFGADALLDATIMSLKTHGGRSFLEGHLIGDNIHDFIAPSIYEGENEMLGMAEFKGLVKEHGMKYMAPFAKIKGFKPYNPVHAWKAKGALVRVGMWTLWGLLNGAGSTKVAGLDRKLQGHVTFALKRFRKLMRQVHFAMLTYQLKLADRQQRMISLSADVQKTITMLVTCLHASELGDEATVLAADVLCRQLTHEIRGSRPTDADFYVSVKLAKLVAAGKFKQLEGVQDSPILQAYDKPAKPAKVKKA